ncbi:MAG TPA: hypothetical protein VM286_01780 [Candidatus Thermoplasmatota archaeon]|nr:hypothetical protein [Candidatus Thermoplasmatota archaeon]
MRLAALGILLGALLGGCAGAGPPGGGVPNLSFPPMALATVPLEPLEGRGTLELGWQDGLFAVRARNEGGMPAMAIRDGDRLFLSQTGMGWSAWDLADYVARSPRGFRYLAWDVPALLAMSEPTGGAGRLEARTSLVVEGSSHAVALEVEHAGGEARKVVIRSDLDPEAPFTLTPLGHAFPFPVATPTALRPIADVVELDGKARESHVALLQLVNAYAKNHAGTLPQDLDRQTLQVELATSGATWPQNPYDGAPLAPRDESGHFQWVRCSLTDGHYIGNGWDGPLLDYPFGKGC